MVKRNRAEGWQHAKISGHENENLIAELTLNDEQVRERLLKCAHISDVTIDRIEYGGLCETDIDCVLGGKTKSKTDMWLYLSNGKRLNVSIKKEDKGQVFLISTARFISGFEKQYNKTVPACVKRALSLYFGSASDIIEIIDEYACDSAYKTLERRKHRLVAETLDLYSNELYKCLIDWFNEHIAEIFDFCFSKGLAKNEEDWAHIIWYKNMIGENEFDKMIFISDIANKLPPNAEYGTKNGGSTIQLPFGFVQWHSPRKVIPGNIQFHHSYKKLKQISE